MKNLWQMIGAGLLILVFVCMLMGETGVAYGVLLCAGLMDLGLVVAQERTISQWVQKLWPKKIDYLLLGVLSTLTFITFFRQFGFIVGMKAILPLFVFFLLLHFFADENTD